MVDTFAKNIGGKVVTSVKSIVYFRHFKVKDLFSSQQLIVVL